MIFLFFLFLRLFSAFEFRGYGEKSRFLKNKSSVIQSGYFGNPAGYIFNKKNAIYFSVEDLYSLGFIRSANVSYFFDITRETKIGIGFQNLSTTSKFEYFSYNENLFSLVFSQRVCRFLSLGISINSGFASLEKKGSFQGVDMGVLFKKGGMRVGVYLENVLSNDVYWQDGRREEVEFRDYFGAGFEGRRFGFYIEEEKNINAGIILKLGTVDFIFGYKNKEYPVFSFGIELSLIHI